MNSPDSSLFTLGAHLRRGEASGDARQLFLQGGRQADTFFNIIKHSAVKHDAPLLRARQAANGVNQRGFTRARDAKNGRNATGGERLTNLQAVGTQRLGKIELKHVYFPIR